MKRYVITEEEKAIIKDYYENDMGEKLIAVRKISRDGYNARVRNRHKIIVTTIVEIKDSGTKYATEIDWENLPNEKVLVLEYLKIIGG